MDKACYRELTPYKYQLMEPYGLNINIKGYEIETPYLKLNADGNLEIAKGYAWDGPSGPTFDTTDFMRGSLVHDALYQLLRLGEISPRYKAYADLLLKKICLEDGMPNFRANYVYQAVKWFGGSSAKPGSEKPAKIICVPM
ncbi:conserved hypothetical protein [Desulfosarcina cetonica]|uniref:hypothetical protein n=1 Tax=Desulfosarcina cetonica TaxID=90730 RepID=UPI0006D25B54|nr:hypothetical protein [Desulfosarcina cetonica]VTR70248.1 conserved hypothetical protein [Desulfosarcina cetonica]